jgi:hypothetical protein
MNSWKLLTNLIVFWNAVDNPIFLQATRHSPGWYEMYARIVNASGFVLVVGGLGCYLSTLAVFYFSSLLILLVPVMLAWTLVVGVALAPAIVAERERRTWETLLTTPLTVETVVLGRAGGALWWLRDAIRIMIGLLALSTVVIGLVGLILIAGSGADPHAMPGWLLCGAALTVPFLVAILFVADRAQYFVLMVIAALAASASARTSRAALAATSTTAIAVWLLDAGVAALALILLPGHAFVSTSGNTLALATLGPFVGYLSAFSLSKLLMLAALTFAAREIMIRALWRVTLRRARAI